MTTRRRARRVTAWNRAARPCPHSRVVVFVIGSDVVSRCAHCRQVLAMNDRN
ncbi:MAG TPA: hypothetical protein VFW89_04145 [Gemmatimonadaceae bacterium]|nr:hypothetical protein [Gemmatimonadaceae bacterium]